MHKRPLIASVLRVLVEGLLGTFLSSAVDSGEESTVSPAMVRSGHAH
jgi:hypothetical protein